MAKNNNVQPKQLLLPEESQSLEVERNPAHPHTAPGARPSDRFKVRASWNETNDLWAPRRSSGVNAALQPVCIRGQCQDAPGADPKVFSFSMLRSLSLDTVFCFCQLLAYDARDEMLFCFIPTMNH